ncbi:hypothetical protein [Kribbella speibonae]|uniref:Uncharacterized protein n=1 Tax=Kribbella speibonae TaxID=1572660 RepID=A0A4R0JJK7_9ACTN|nr:hypothetical protein [Kribbella speibonae]TCC41975.1 hypothetical protein E0H92_10170 [Kribbella speibonae]
MADAIACGLFLFGATSHKPLWLLLSGFGFATIWASFRIWQLSVIRPVSSDPCEPSTEEPQLTERIESILDKSHDLELSAVQLTTFAYLLLYPENTRRRIKESMDLREQLITKSASAEINRELNDNGDTKLEKRLDDDDGPLYVPIMRPLKKRLITGLSVHDKSGSAIATLSHEESLVFLTRLLLKLFAETFDTSSDYRSWSFKEGVVFMAVMEAVLQIPQDETTDSASRQSRRGEATNGLRSLVTAKELRIADADSFERLCAVVRLLALNYVIIAEHPSEHRFLVRYSYRVPKRPIHRGKDVSFWAHMKGWTRALIRSDAAYLQVPVNKAKRCDSYHLVLTAPNGTHFARAILKDERGKSVAKLSQRQFSLGSAYFRLGERGYQEAHFYSRQLWKSPNAAYLDVRIQETPPGRLGRAALVAAFALFLAYVVGLSSQSKAPEDLNLDFAAVLAAGIPSALAVLAFVLGSTAEDSRVIAIFAVPSAVVTAVVALIGSALLMFPAHITDADKIRASFDFFGVYAVGWLLLCSAATVNLAITVCALIVRLVRHDKLRRRTAASLDVEALVSR